MGCVFVYPQLHRFALYWGLSLFNTCGVFFMLLGVKNGFVYAALRFALCPACAGMTVGCEDDMWEGA